MDEKRKKYEDMKSDATIEYNKELKYLNEIADKLVKRPQGAPSTTKPLATEQNKFDPLTSKTDHFIDTVALSNTFHDIALEAIRRKQLVGKTDAKYDESKKLLGAIRWLIGDLEDFPHILDQFANLVRAFVNDDNMTFTTKTFLNMSITGPPGVGKTRTAEKIASFLGELGVLVYTEHREISRSDLIGQYVGQTAPRVQALFKSNLERVLFLDEAYGLTRYEQDKTSSEKNARKLESFSDEAITELLTLFNKYSGQSAFIVAGYYENMERDFFAANPGLKRRFSYFFHIPEYSPNKLYKIYVEKYKKEHKYDLEQHISPGAQSLLIRSIEGVRRKYKEEQEKEDSENNLESENNIKDLMLIDDEKKSTTETTVYETILKDALIQATKEKHFENPYQLIYDFYNQQAAAMTELTLTTLESIKSQVPKDKKFTITSKTMFGILATQLEKRQALSKDKRLVVEQLRRIVIEAGFIGNEDNESANYEEEPIDDPLNWPDWNEWQESVYWRPGYSPGASEPEKTAEQRKDEIKADQAAKKQRKSAAALPRTSLRRPRGINKLGDFADEDAIREAENETLSHPS